MANSVKRFEKRTLVDLLKLDSALSETELSAALDLATASEEEVELDLAGKADKASAVAAADSAATVAAAAPTQTASYVQGDVQAIADLANDLKAKYDAAVTLINELKTKLNAMNA